MRADPVLAAAAERLKAAGIPDPAREVLGLAAHAAGVSLEEWLLRSRPLGDDARGRFETLVARRARREPYAYLVGRTTFYGLDLVVTPAVLVPRPETELLVDAALAHCPPRPGRVVDVGTGSGALALALARHGPPVWRVEAVDIDLAALEVARTNRDRLGLAVCLYPSDLLAQVRPGILGIVANLPYVAWGDTVDPEVRHEPPVAVFAGPDGLGLIRRLVAQARGRLEPGGWLGLEVGAGQADVVQAWLATAGFRPVGVETDWAGIGRIVWGVWPGGV
ncbi:MAG: peptide chain release factor N(5)-glutamine methyltransferase [Actinomycetia bacterium]|nr:peptide chain release factor N(5)-glutamine methyltransferase [Actinomycetes bacterium]